MHFKNREIEKQKRDKGGEAVGGNGGGEGCRNEGRKDIEIIRGDKRKYEQMMNKLKIL